MASYYLILNYNNQHPTLRPQGWKFSVSLATNHNLPPSIYILKLGNKIIYIVVVVFKTNTVNLFQTEGFCWKGSNCFTPMFCNFTGLKVKFKTKMTRIIMHLSSYLRVLTNRYIIQKRRTITGFSFSIISAS